MRANTLEDIGRKAVKVQELKTAKRANGWCEFAKDRSSGQSCLEFPDMLPSARCASCNRFALLRADTVRARNTLFVAIRSWIERNRAAARELPKEGK